MNDSPERPIEQDTLGGGHILTGGGAWTGGNSSAGRDWVGRDLIGIVVNVYNRPLDTSLLTDSEGERILREYLEWILMHYNEARLFGMSDHSRNRDRLCTRNEPTLRKVFVPQKLRSSGAHGGELPLFNLLTVSGRIVLKGGEGSGKSAILKHVAVDLAQRVLNKTDLLYSYAGVSVRLPIIIELRKYRQYIESDLGRRENSWEEFIANAVMKQSSVKAPADFFARLLQGGGCLLLIDGLDEVVDTGRRSQLRQQIEWFGL